MAMDSDKRASSEASFEVAFAALTQLGKASERTAIGERTLSGPIVGSTRQTSGRRQLGRIDCQKAQSRIDNASPWT